MIIFVTGGSGYIGRNLIRDLREQGHTIRALARSERAAAIVESLGAEPVRGDLFDDQALKRGMEGADILFHLAADTDHGRGTKAQMAANQNGTARAYAAAKASAIKRAIHLSTEAVLLTGEPLIDADETTPLPTHFPGAYSASKAAAEQIALNAATHGLEVIVVRPRFVWGRDDTTALPALVDAARNGKLKWIDGGHYKTSTTHIANLCHGLKLALEKGESGEVYFITDGPPVEFRAFITDLLATRTIAPPTGEVPRAAVKLVIKIGEVLNRLSFGVITPPMSMQEYATLGVAVTLNIHKAKTKLGYRPIISRDEGLRELITIREDTGREDTGREDTGREDTGQQKMSQ